MIFFPATLFTWFLFLEKVGMLKIPPSWQMPDPFILIFDLTIQYFTLHFKFPGTMNTNEKSAFNNVFYFLTSLCSHVFVDIPYFITRIVHCNQNVIRSSTSRSPTLS